MHVKRVLESRYVQGNYALMTSLISIFNFFHYFYLFCWKWRPHALNEYPLIWCILFPPILTLTSSSSFSKVTCTKTLSLSFSIRQNLSLILLSHIPFKVQRSLIIISFCFHKSNLKHRGVNFYYDRIQHETMG